ncbi:MAG: NAD-dependent epimerase/dehydratase family protein [Limnochordia bacterium]|jgi:UDP-glucose 4-epimerase
MVRLNILLTGATGFIGSYILKLLQQEGHKVVGFDKLVDNTSIQQILTPEELAQTTIVQGDIQDLPTLLSVCKEHHIDTIVHTASLMGVASRNTQAAVNVNIKGTINIFDTARILGMRRVVWASSQTVFGPQDKHPQEWIPNDGPHFPMTMYAACKSFLEYVGRYYYESYGLDTIALRYCAVYGLGRLRGSDTYLNNLIVYPALGKKGIVDYGDDAPNLLYVKDAARATLLACTVPSTESRAFTITGEIKPLTEVRDYVLQLIPDAEIELKPGYYPSGWKFDTRVVEEELGYKPEYDVERGVKELIQLVQASRDRLDY